jgi:FkbM family methyltransferase
MNLKILSNNLKDSVEELFVYKRDRFRIRNNRYQNNLRQLELRSILADPEIDLVIDVGANEGQFASGIRNLGYKKRLISFEPIPDVFLKLKSKAAAVPNWEVVNCALGSETKKQILNIYDDSKLSSFLEGDGSHTVRFQNNFKQSKQVNLEIRRLDEIWNEKFSSGTVHQIFLKLDTQGYDLEAFKGIGRLKDHVKYILTELSVIPLYKNITPYTQSLEFYENEGFGPIAFIPVTRNHGDGRVIEFDCLLTRKTTN